MMSIILETPTITATVRWIDLAAFFAMGVLWLLIFAMLAGIAWVLRSKARDARGWGDSPGL
jgi:heme/copper-type cytochrome/quinol oxidase subunit 2